MFLVGFECPPIFRVVISRRHPGSADETRQGAMWLRRVMSALSSSYRLTSLSEHSAPTWGVNELFHNLGICPSKILTQKVPQRVMNYPLNSILFPQNLIIYPQSHNIPTKNYEFEVKCHHLHCCAFLNKSSSLPEFRKGDLTLIWQCRDLESVSLCHPALRKAPFPIYMWHWRRMHPELWNGELGIWKESALAL